MPIANNHLVAGMFVVVIITADLFTIISASASLLQTKSVVPSVVTVEEGHDVILPFTFYGDLGPNDEVRWRMLPNTSSDRRPTWKSIFSSKGNNPTTPGYQVNQVMPGQFDLVVRNASKSAAGTYEVTVDRVGHAKFSVRVVSVFMSVECRATLTDDATTTLVCSVEHADTTEYPEVEWSGWPTYCATVNETNGTSSVAGRRIRKATCSGASSTVRETVRTCVVRSTHNATLGVLWMKCSVDIGVGRGSNSELEASVKPTGSVSGLQLTTADLGQSGGTDRTDEQSDPRAEHRLGGNVSAGARTVSSSGLVYYLLFGLLTFVRHLDSWVPCREY